MRMKAQDIQDRKEEEKGNERRENRGRKDGSKRTEDEVIKERKMKDDGGKSRNMKEDAKEDGRR